MPDSYQGIASAMPQLSQNQKRLQALRPPNMAFPATHKLAARDIPVKSFRRDILEGIPNSLSVFTNLRSREVPGYPLRKSFRRDILRGYL